MAKDWGLIEEGVNGRFAWPFANMQEGDYFRVDPRAKPRGAVANQAYVSGNRTGKRFGVGDDPDHPGFTRVTCKADEHTKPKRYEQREMDYQEAIKFIGRFYGTTAGIRDMHWTGMDAGQRDYLEISMVDGGEPRDFMVNTAGHKVHVDMSVYGIALTAVEPSCTVEEFRKRKLLDD